VEKMVSELGVRVAAVEVDVTDATQVAAWFGQTEDELGPVGAMVSCAGITRDQPLAQLAAADWRTVIDGGRQRRYRQRSGGPQHLLFNVPS
jgi:3-oxoacyl-[acyl-carrier protein] reductase